MVVTPNTNIVLLKTPIELDSTNQLTFANKNAQYNYFNSLPKLSYDNATYQRKDGVIAFPTSPTGVTYEDLIQYNYCMYQNTSYDDKWFYAFITKITYDNNGMSYIEIETDVFQTWQFDITYKPSFIDREMLSTADDVVGANVIPEGLETGEFITQRRDFMFLGRGNDLSFICVAVSEDLIDDTNPIQMYYRVPSGLKYILLKGQADLKKFLVLYAGKKDAINSIFVIPAGLIPVNDPLTWSTYTIPFTSLTLEYCYFPSYSNATSVGQIDIPFITQIQEYTPKNKKLLTYPYCFIRVDNGCGNFGIYRFEDFDMTYELTTDLRFTALGVISQGCSLKVIANNYKEYKINDSSNYSDSVNVAKFPIGGWISDPYINWLTQNSVNMNTSFIKSTVGGAVTGSIFAGGLGGVAGAIGGAFNSILSNYTEMESHDRIPLQAEGNVNSSDLMYASINNRPIIEVMTIKKQFAQSIDDFFSMFGYKTNRVKIPNLNNRSNWNYVKTKGCNIIGNIPQQDLQKIKELFDNGITLWHNASTFLDYSQSNT